MRGSGREAQIDRLAKVLLYTATARLRPSAVTIARGLGISERTAKRYLVSLERAGWPMGPKRREVN